MAGFLGWLACVLFIKMLLQGLVRNQEALAVSAGRLAADAIDMDALIQKIKDPAHLESVRPVIETHVHTFLEVKLQEKMPAIAMFVGGSTLDKLKAGLLEEIDLLLPEVIGSYAGKMSSALDMRQLVTSKIAGMPAVAFKQILCSMLVTRLRYFKLAGAVTGMIIVLVQYLISMFLTSFTRPM